MIQILESFRKWRSRKTGPSREETASIFRAKYEHFKQLLASNTELLNIITDMEDKLQGQRVFGMSYVRSQSARCVFHTLRMIESLNALSRNRYSHLGPVLETINAKIRDELERRREAPLTDLVLPYTKINRDMVDFVGGKNANLGEVLNRVQLPVPEGFAITTRAYDTLLAHNDLVDEIHKIKMELDINNPESIQTVSEDIQRLIIAAKVPAELEEAIVDGYRQLTRRLCETGFDCLSPPVSMRSSAIGEDSELSFAGQYLSLLNVPEHQLLQSYKYIVASLYTPRAISYRLNKGIRDEDIAMSVACLQMVASVASGVIYTSSSLSPHRGPHHHQRRLGAGALRRGRPYNARHLRGGQGPGKHCDRKPDLAQTGAIGHQPRWRPDGGPGGRRTMPRLVPATQSGEDTGALCHEAGRTLPLRSGHRMGAGFRRAPAGFADTPAAAAGGGTGGRRGGTSASEGFPGFGGRRCRSLSRCGLRPGFHVDQEGDLVNFPDGAVLVAKHSSPKYVVVMPKAQAIVTESGSVTGHMASLCREFQVPSLLGVQGAMSTIATGDVITVDGFAGRVYRGRVEELLARHIKREPFMKGSPVYETLRRVADLIVPLHLLDPRSETFTPAHCQTLHDIMRFVHEKSYLEMFQISDLVSDVGAGSLKLQAPIPLDLYVIDLGGGTAGLGEHAHKVSPKHIVSAPFSALLKGMLHEDLLMMRPRPVEFSGFFSVMREQMLANPQAVERFGDRSYAIISDKYINFSSRVGYHYSVLDAYCGQTVNKNYITFSFKGGAADDLRRNRRARSIAVVLMASDFSVDVQGDRVDARFAKYPGPEVEEKLEVIGRLLIFTRQMDMLMSSEASVEQVAKNFLEGNYHYD